MTWLSIVVVIVSMHVPGDGTVTAQRLVEWYASVGIPITATVGEPLSPTVEQCADLSWWRYAPRRPGLAYLYVVDGDCWPRWRVGLALPSLGIAFAAVGPGMDAVAAHEIGHVLGATDDYAATDLMSPNLWQAYVDGQLSIRAWLEMGGPPPDHVVMVPAVMR